MESVHPIFSNGNAYTIQELTLGQAIEIAKIPDGKHEKKITALLSVILGDKVLPYQLTLQERHYLMMKYVEHKKDTFGFDIDFSLFEKEQEELEQVEINGYTFRHLNGYECEALEDYASNYLEFVLGSIALQVSSDTLPAMTPATDIKFAKNIIEARVADLHRLDLETADLLLSSYYEAMEQLNNLVNYGFDDEGVLLIGGTDENSVRFCEISTIPATVRSVLETITQ